MSKKVLVSLVSLLISSMGIILMQLMLMIFNPEMIDGKLHQTAIFLIIFATLLWIYFIMTADSWRIEDD